MHPYCSINPHCSLFTSPLTTRSQSIYEQMKTRQFHKCVSRSLETFLLLSEGTNRLRSFCMCYTCIMCILVLFCCEYFGDRDVQLMTDWAVKLTSSCLYNVCKCVYAVNKTVRLRPPEHWTRPLCRFLLPMWNFVWTLGGPDNDND